MVTRPTIAQSTVNSSVKTNSSKTQPVIFKPPPSKGKPKNTSAAGSRGQCPQDTIATSTTTDTRLNKPSLMALVPSDTNYGVTTAERPTLLVYLPQTSAKQVVLSLIEEGKKHHSQASFPITGEPGIISIKPSDNSPPLEVDKNYQWALVLVCGEKPSPNDPAIASWVRRVALPQPLSSQKTPLEQAVWYGEQGIWYDAVAALAKVRKAQPGNSIIENNWIGVLKSVGLETIATEPLRF